MAANGDERIEKVDILNKLSAYHSFDGFGMLNIIVGG